MKSVLSRINPIERLANRFYRGPNDYLASTLSQNPLAISQLDEIGPWFIENNQGSVKVWVLILIEIITRKIYLLPMQHPDTVSFIRALEILQSRRSRMTKIIIDQHPVHLLLVSEKPTTGTTLRGVPDTLYRALSKGDQALLEKHGIGVIIADGNQHSVKMQSTT